MEKTGLSKGEKLNLVKAISQEVFEEQDQTTKDKIEEKLTELADLMDDDDSDEEDV